MTAVTAAQKMTAEEFLELPIEPGRVWNLVEGELVVNDPGILHQRLALRIVAAIERWTHSEQGRGRASLSIDVQLDSRNVYKPDGVWYAHARAPHDDDPRPYPMPDLAVEVRSPSTWRYDVGAKKAGYERAGLRELWLVDTPAGAVLVFRRSAPRVPRFDVALELAAGDVLDSPLLAGFALPIDELFAEG